MNSEDVTALSRHLRAQGYTTRTVKRTHDKRPVTAARRNEGDLMRAAAYPVTGGVACVKAMTTAVHSQLGRLVPVLVDYQHLSGSLATPELVVEALL